MDSGTRRRTQQADLCSKQVVPLSAGCNQNRQVVKAANWIRAEDLCARWSREKSTGGSSAEGNKLVHLEYVIMDAQSLMSTCASLKFTPLG